MSAKSYARGTEVIKRQIDSEFLKEEVRAGRMVDRINADMARLETENTSLKAELEKARAAYHRRAAEVNVLKEELQEANKQRELEHANFVNCARALEGSRKGHQKLTAVMELALTPEQYREYRGAAAEVYPELFQKQDE